VLIASAATRPARIPVLTEVSNVRNELAGCVGKRRTGCYENSALPALTVRTRHYEKGFHFFVSRAQWGNWTQLRDRGAAVVHGPIP